MTLSTGSRFHLVPRVSYAHGAVVTATRLLLPRRAAARHAVLGLASLCLDVDPRNGENKLNRICESYRCHFGCVFVVHGPEGHRNTREN